MLGADSSNASAAQEVPARLRFPALDPEPPRRPWRIAGRILVAVAVVLAAGIGYSVLSRGGHATGPSARAAGSRTGGSRSGPAFGGVVLAETPGGVLTLTDLDTGKVVVLKKLGQFNTTAVPDVSADGAYLLDLDTGRLLSLSRLADPVAAPNKLSFEPGLAAFFLPQPWSDHDGSVIEMNLSNEQSTLPVAAVQSVQSGRVVSLGSADYAAGDPQQPGAFVAVPASTPPSQSDVQPDGKLDLTDVGQHPRVLATAAALKRAVHITAGTPVTLVPTVNPQGTKVAVQIQSIYGKGAGGIVVLSRAGQVLGTELTSGSPTIAWSGAGNTLAFVGAGAAGLEVTEWEVGVQSVTNVLDGSGGAGGYQCFWSPDGKSVLCAGPKSTWIVTRPASPDNSYEFTGDGQVLGWLNGRLG